MRFDHVAWQQAPVRTGLRVFTSLIRKRIQPLAFPHVPYDGARSRIYADLGTPLGLQLYRYGIKDPDIELVKRLLSPADVFVDGGANVGLFTLAAASVVGTTGKVIAFEPARDVRLRLIQNVALNRMTQVEVLPFALSSAPGEAAFRTFDLAGAGLNHLGPVEGESGRVESVQLTTLDTALGPSDRRRLTLVKLDLEGAEHAALLGASEILRDIRPDLIIEVAEDHLARLGSSVSDIARLLKGYGYEFFRTGKNDLAEVLTPLPDLQGPMSGPNVFATTDVRRARDRGVRLA
jgi:FkbM family methyltransferase